VATKKEGDKGREADQVEAKDKPFVVHAVLESVDAERAVITVKGVTGDDANAVFMLFVANGDAADTRPGFQLGTENMRKVLDALPKFVNVPVRSDAKVVSGKETLQLKDLRTGSVVSLQLAADPITGLKIAEIGVTDLNDLTRLLFG